MNNHIYSFKSLGDNKYEMFYKNDSLGITFITPDGCSIEDYDFNFTENGFKPCKDVVIRLQNPPKAFKRINIESNADITFNGGLSFCVGNSITLAKNKNSLFCAKDGVKEIVVDSLMIKGNKNSSVSFYPTPEGATTRDDKRVKGKGYPFDAVFRNNERVDLKLQDQFVVLYIESLTSNKPYSITLDCTSSVFVTSNFGSFTVNKYDAEVKFKADRVEFSYPTFKVEDISKNSVATFENISKDKDKLNSISFLGGHIDILGEAHITTDAKRLAINQQGSGGEDGISFSGNNFISAKNQVSIINGKFCGNANIKSNSEELTFLSREMNNHIKDSDINVIVKAKRGKNKIIIDGLVAEHSILDNVKGNSFSGQIYNTKITNSDFGDNTKIVIDALDSDCPTYLTEIDNLILKKNTTLQIYGNLKNVSKREINNCVVEKGKFRIDNDAEYKLYNSVLSSGEIFLNNKKEMIISNSNIKGSNELKNISSIDCSILENADISSSKLIGLKDEMIIDQKILDYSAHLSQPNQKEVSSNSIITKEIEIL